MNAGVVLRRHWMVIPRWKEAIIPAGILTVCCIASATPNSVSLFGFHLPNTCPFKAFTGLDCPGCGLTRALILALHGRLLDSYNMHLWGIPLLLFLVWRIFSAISGAHPVPLLPPSLEPWKNRVIALSLVVPWIMKTAALILLR